MADAPLAGWRVVVTRADAPDDSLSRALAAAGAHPVPFPTIAFAPPTDPAPLHAALARLATSTAYDWLVLTSATTVRMLTAALAAAGLTLTSGGFRLAAVGSATARACQAQLGLEAACVPDTFVAEALADALGNLRGQRVLLANADLSRPVLHERLTAAGAQVERVIAYHTVPGSGGADVPSLLRAGQLDALTFTSGSTARFFAQRLAPAGPDLLPLARQCVVACIGPVAAAAAAEAGLPPTLVAEPSTMPGLVAALAQWRLAQG